MSRQILLVLLALCFGFVHGQRHTRQPAATAFPGASTNLTDAMGRPYFVRMDPATVLDADGLLRSEAFRQHWGELAFSPGKPQADALGQTHTRYTASHQGHPIAYACLILHTQGGRVIGYNAALPAPSQLTGRASVSLEAARAAALAHVGARRYKWESPGDEAALRAQTGNLSASYFPTAQLMYVPVGDAFEQGPYRLAYRFDIYALEPLSRDWVDIDAETGQPIARHSRLHSYDVQGVGFTAYNGNVNLIADRTAPTSYRLREAGRGGGIQTLNCNYQPNFQNVTDFTDGNNVWSSFNPALDRYALDCHYGMEMTYDYFSQVHGWNSIDNQGLPLIGYMHYGTNYGNAHWDGTQMLIGDGDGTLTTSPLSPLEIVAHELSHGLTQFSANLAYFGQAGALNESISDIFGTVIEARVHPTTWSWRIGTQCTPGGVGVRDMADPNLFQDPSVYGGTYYSIVNDVHVNSAIGNKWFQLLVDGDTAVNELGQAYAVERIGMDKAAAITFRMLTVYLPPSGNFALARTYAAAAATDLYGHCSAERVAVENAWYAVGIGTPAAILPTAAFTLSPAYSCQLPTGVQFTDQSIGGDSLIWNFGDGLMGYGIDPGHLYQQPGSYDVTLVAIGCNGDRDTVQLLQSVTLDSGLVCGYPMLTSGTDTIDVCGAHILDPGGYGDFTQPSLGKRVLVAPPGNRIVLNFSSFSMPLGDQLRVFDGSNINAPQIAVIQGAGQASTNLPPILSSGNTLFLQLYAAANAVPPLPGFDIVADCYSNMTPPSASMIVTPVDTCNGLFGFASGNNLNVSSVFWDFGDGSTSTVTQTTHQYTVPGTYTVTLIVCGSGGCDTVVGPGIASTALLGSFCPVTMEPTGTTVVEACHGVLLDPGGAGNYPNLRQTTVQFNLHGADSILFTFSEFDLQQGSDYLDIYQLANGNATLIGSFTGNSLPLGGRISVPSAYAKAVFRSDVSGVAPGFRMDWLAFGAANGPSAAIVAPQTANPGTPVAFSQVSSGAVYWRWDFGDGDTSSLFAPTHTYPNVGVYRVRLTLRNADHCYNVVEQNVYVGMVGQAAPVSPGLAVWPNPSTGWLEVAARLSGTAPARIEVRNALGQLIHAETCDAADEVRRSLDLRGVTAGLYFVRVESGGAVAVRKVVIRPAGR